MYFAYRNCFLVSGFCLEFDATVVFDNALSFSTDFGNRNSLNLANLFGGSCMMEALIVILQNKTKKCKPEPLYLYTWSSIVTL